MINRVGFQISLPADVLWGSFVTHSFNECLEASFKWAWIKVLRSLFEVLAFKTRVFKSVFITANLLCSCQISFLVVVEWTKPEWLKKKLKKFRLNRGSNPDLWPDDRTQRSSLNVFRFFFNGLGCSFYWENHVHFRMFIRSSKYIHSAFPYTIKIYCEKVGFAARLSYVNVVKDYFSLSVMFWKMH